MHLATVLIGVHGLVRLPRDERHVAAQVETRDDLAPEAVRRYRPDGVLELEVGRLRVEADGLTDVALLLVGACLAEFLQRYKKQQSMI